MQSKISYEQLLALQQVQQNFPKIKQKSITQNNLKTIK